MSSFQGGYQSMQGGHTPGYGYGYGYGPGQLNPCRYSGGSLGGGSIHIDQFSRITLENLASAMRELAAALNSKPRFRIKAKSIPVRDE